MSLIRITIVLAALACIIAIHISQEYQPDRATDFRERIEKRLTKSK